MRIRVDSGGGNISGELLPYYIRFEFGEIFPWRKLSAIWYIPCSQEGGVFLITQHVRNEVSALLECGHTTPRPRVPQLCVCVCACACVCVK